MAQMQDMQVAPAIGQGPSFSKVTNYLGAAASLALIVGISVWGYKLVMRDVSGVPVVRAEAGPMRLQPDNPGGQQAQHQGLSVNDVAAAGTAAPPPDQLVLAPEPLDLTADDTVLPSVGAEIAQGQDNYIMPAVDETLSGEAPSSDMIQLAAVERLAEQLAEGIPPLEDLQEPAPGESPADYDAEDLTELEGTDAAVTVALQDTAPPKEGLGRSLRPKLRPASVSAASIPQPTQAVMQTTPQAAPAAVQPVPALAPNDVDPAALPSGTRLAQLGAYDSAETARAEWDRMSRQLGEILDGKQRVIQKAKSGGRTFYRLRAMGFDDLADARRFCSALVAEKADCIPVVTR